MVFPKEFKEKVKRVYPGWETIQTFLDDDSELACRQLFDKCVSGISVDTILRASSLEELQNLARREKEKWALYRECVTLLRAASEK